MAKFLVIKSYDGQFIFDEFQTMAAAKRNVRNLLDNMSWTIRKFEKSDDGLEYKIWDITDRTIAIKIMESVHENTLFVWSKEYNDIKVCYDDVKVQTIKENWEGLGLYKYTE